MKKSLVIFLCLLMLCSSLVSCAKVDVSGDKQNAVVNDATGELSEVDEYISYLAEKNDFRGKTFTWIGGGSQAPTDDEETGDLMSDALFHRQMEIEEKFLIDWQNFSPPESEGMVIHPVVESVKQDVLAGTGAYDAGYGTL